MTMDSKPTEVPADPSLQSHADVAIVDVPTVRATGPSAQPSGEQPSTVAKKRSLFEKLADELIITVAEFLTAQELLTAEQISRRWRQLLSFTALWMPHVQSLWRETGWRFNKPALVPLSVRIAQSCGVAQLKKALVLYDTTALVEKKDFITLVRAKLLFGKLLKERDSNGRLVIPEWAKATFNDGKAAWIFSRQELRRLLPLESELLAEKWDLHYYNQGEHPPFEIEFFPNHEMTATSHGDARFSWRLQGLGPGLEPGLQVEAFPLHRFSRDPDGRWLMTNDHVVITQRVTEDSPLPLM